MNTAKAIASIGCFETVIVCLEYALGVQKPVLWPQDLAWVFLIFALPFVWAALAIWRRA